jgi:hypothetical protein
VAHQGQTTLSAPGWPAELLFAISTALWAALTAIYFVGGVRRSGTFAADRKHAIYGPFAAYVPIVGILLVAHYEQYGRVAGRIAVAVFVVALTVIAAQLLAHWLLGNLAIATFHPGYFLPTVKSEDANVGPGRPATQRIVASATAHPTPCTAIAAATSVGAAPPETRSR